MYETEKKIVQNGRKHYFRCISQFVAIREDSYFSFATFHSSDLSYIPYTVYVCMMDVFSRVTFFINLGWLFCYQF